MKLQVGEFDLLPASSATAISAAISTLSPARRFVHPELIVESDLKLGHAEIGNISSR